MEHLKRLSRNIDMVDMHYLCSVRERSALELIKKGKINDRHSKRAWGGRHDRFYASIDSSPRHDIFPPHFLVVVILGLSSSPLSRSET